MIFDFYFIINIYIDILTLLFSLFSEYLYPSTGKPLDVRQIDGQYELFTLVEKTIKMR